MAIVFACVCGRPLQVSDALAGKAVRCPNCSKVVVAPVAPAIAVATATVIPESVAPPPPSMHVWLYPPKHDIMLLGVTGDSLWQFAKTFTSAEPEAKRIAAGEDPATVLGDKATRIPLNAITKLATDKKRANLVVYFREKNKKDQWVDRSKEFFIDDPAKRDDVISSLQQRLGQGWRTREEQLTAMDAVGGHVIAIVLTLIALPIILWLVHWLQGDDFFADLAGGSWRFRLGRAVINLAQAILRWLGVVVDGIVILAAVGLVVMWGLLLISQVRMPPLMWYLEKDV